MTVQSNTFPRAVARFWFSGLLLLVTTYCQQAFSIQQLSDIDAYKTIMVDGSELSSAVGFPIQEFSLAAVSEGELEPIPFQIDEYNEGGAVYFEGWDVPISGSKGIVDQKDKLLFIYKDAGPRRKANQRYDGEIVHEIILTNELGHTRYAYLVRNSRLRSDEQYVRYSAEEALVETDFYSITYNKDNHINWDDFSIVNYEGNENPFDALKIRLETGVITSLAKTQLNNKNLIAIPKGEHSGPIRTTTQMELTLWFLKLPLLRISLQLHHSPNSLLYDVRSVLPETRRSMLAEPQVLISLEGNELYGTELRTALGPKAPGITDGKITSTEQHHIESGISQTENWIWASTRRNLDFVAFFEYTGEQTETLSLHYHDDKNIVDLPERFPGQLPNIGYKIHSMPASGYFGFAVNIHMSNGYQGNPDLFTDKLRRLPDISITLPQQESRPQNQLTSSIQSFEQH